MGLAYARVKLANPRLPDLAPVEVEALADTGSVHVCVPASLALQLKLEEIDCRNVASADGNCVETSYVGPLSIFIANRKCFAGAIVLGDHVSLGSIAMDDMDLVVDPKTRQVVPNPTNPNVAGSTAVGMGRPRRVN